MSEGNAKNISVVGIETESTEGTYVAPSAATSYFQPMADGFELVPSREKIERGILTSSIGKATPRMGIKAVSGSFAVEMRASGTEGADVDAGLLIKGALGATRSISTTTTTKSSGNTGSALQIQDADISKFAVGDIICVKESGGHHVCAVTAVATGAGVAALTITPAKASGSFSNSVVISKSTMYYTANSGHPALSVSTYLANTIRTAGIGCKVTSMAVDNFTPGQLATLNFGLQGLTFTEIDGAAPHTPTYDSGTAPIILSASVYRAGTEINVNKFALSLANKLGFITATGNANGKVSSRVVERTITGAINPYMDDTSVTQFDDFVAGTEFSLFIKAFNPSATTGEHTMGSIVGIYLPKCVANEFKHADQDGILVNEISFTAARGSDGSTEEMYMGLI